MPHAELLEQDRIFQPIVLRGLAIEPPRLRATAPSFEPEPPGIPEVFAPSFPGLETEEEEELQREIVPLIPKEMSPEELTVFRSRSEAIWRAVPGITPAVAIRLATSQTPLEQAIKLGQAQTETQKRKGLFAQALMPAKAVFIDAPEWLYNRVIVDPFQWIAEGSGIDRQIAQRMSPGQIIWKMANWQTLDDDPELWGDGARYASGAFDLLVRLTGDPVLVLGKFRATRALPFGAEKLLGIERATSRGELIARRGLETAEEVVTGQKALRHWFTGLLSTREMMSRTLRANNSTQLFVKELISLADDPLALGVLIQRYGVPRRGIAVMPEHLAYLLTKARRAGLASRTGRVEASRSVERGLAELLSGELDTSTKAIAERLVGRYNGLRQAVEDSFATAGRFELKAVATRNQLATRRLLGQAPREAATARQLGQLETAAVGERERVLKLAPKLQEAAVDPDLQGFLGVMGKPSQTKAILNDFGDLAAKLPQAAITDPLQVVPYQKIWGKPVGWLGRGEMFRYPDPRNWPVFRSIAYLPHRELNVHDEFWHDQIRRLGQFFGYQEREVAGAIQTFRGVSGPPAMAKTVSNWMKGGFAKKWPWLTEEHLDDIWRTAAKRTDEGFGVRGGKILDKPMFESQELNVMLLTDPRFMRILDSRWGQVVFEKAPALTRIRSDVTQAMDQWNNIFKRMMIAMPRTGLRVTMETQARALSMGFRSYWTNPHTWWRFFVGYLPEETVLRRFTGRGAVEISRQNLPEEIGRIAIHERDLGMGFTGLMLGSLSRSKWRELQRLPWAEAERKGARFAWAYRKGQANYINDYMVNDRLVRQMIETSPQQARRWLAGPEGSAYLRTHPGKITNADEHFNGVHQMLKEHRVLDPEVRSILRERALDGHDLVGKEAPEILSAYAPLWEGATPETASNVLDSLVRHNLARQEFIGRDFTSRFELRRVVEQKVGQLERQGVTVSREALESELRGGVVRGNLLEQNLVRTAKRDVFKRMKWLFFDMAEHSRASDGLRFIFPFGNAYQEVAQTWLGIVAERPWLPHIGAQIWAAADDVPALTYEDPGTGDKRFIIPLIHWLFPFASMKVPNPVSGAPEGLAYKFGGRLDGLNMVTAGWPIPGPFMNLPARWLIDNFPQAEEAMEILFPFGTRSFIESMEPGYFRDFRAMVAAAREDPEAHTDYAILSANLLTHEVYKTLLKAKEKGGVDDPTKALEEYLTLEDSIDDMEFVDRAKAMMAIRLLSRIALPTVVREVSPLKAEIDYFRFLSQHDPQLAIETFVATRGDEILSLVEQKTRLLRDDVLPPTKGAVKMRAHGPFAKFVEKFGQAGMDVFKESLGGELDSEELRRQLESGGDRVRRTLPEIRHEALTSVLWQRWFDYLEKQDQSMMALGIASINESKAAPFKAARAEYEQRLGDVYRGWAVERMGSPQGRPWILKNQARLGVIAAIPELQGLDSVQGLSEYWALRSKYINLLNANELRSLRGKKALMFNQAFRAESRQIVERHPAFARIWGRYFERDDLSMSLAEILEKSQIVNAIGDISSLEGVSR